MGVVIHIGPRHHAVSVQLLDVERSVSSLSEVTNWVAFLELIFVPCCDEGEHVTPMFFLYLLREELGVGLLASVSQKKRERSIMDPHVMMESDTSMIGLIVVRNVALVARRARMPAMLPRLQHGWMSSLPSSSSNSCVSHHSKVSTCSGKIPVAATATRLLLLSVGATLQEERKENRKDCTYLCKAARGSVVGAG